jgi:hypothetical protein
MCPLVFAVESIIKFDTVGACADDADQKRELVDDEIVKELYVV